MAVHDGAAGVVSGIPDQPQPPAASGVHVQRSTWVHPKIAAINGRIRKAAAFEMAPSTDGGPRRAGSRATFATQLARARQQWLFVEPCMHEPLMITPLDSGDHPHFKCPLPQGWSRECYEAAELELADSEAKRARRRRQRANLEDERALDVRRRLNALLDEVTAGSELLYDGLSALSLDGQALALAIEAHLGRPAIPPPSELLQDLCAAAGLNMDRASALLRLAIDNLWL